MVPNPRFPWLARPSVPSADTLGERRAGAERGKRPEAVKLGGRRQMWREAGRRRRRSEREIKRDRWEARQRKHHEPWEVV